MRVRLSVFASFCFLYLLFGCGQSSSTSGTPNYPPPTLIMLSPASVNAGAAAFTLTATGANFVATSQVLWNGAGLVTTYVSPTSLTAQVPSTAVATAGSAEVTVQTSAPGGGTSAALTFSISAPPNPAPTVSALSPASANAGDAGFTLTMTGSGFLAASQVLWNGAALVTTYVSSTSLAAQVPAAAIATAGAANVAVQTPGPGGGTSTALPFSIAVPPNAAPSLASLNPGSAVTGGAVFTLTVNGSGFAASSQVLWNGAGLATMYVSATVLTARVPASDLTTAGTANVTVETGAPGGGISAALPFTITTPPNPSPSVASLSPAVTNAGGPAFTLTVDGSGFVAASQVLWSGGPLPTTYVSATVLTAQVPATDVATAGTAGVAVQTGAPGGGTSTVLPFTISVPGPTAAAVHVQVLPLKGSDLAWDATHERLYVATASNASSYANSIASVDPVSGAVVAAQQLSTTPTGVALSDDDQVLYAVVNGANSVQRFTLPAVTPDISWSLGQDPVSGAAYLAGEVQVQPGASHTVAVSYGKYSSDFVGIFDDGVRRPAVAGGGLDMLPSSLQWKADGTALYAAGGLITAGGYYTTYSDDPLYTMPVTQTGLGSITTYESAFQAETTHLVSDPTTGLLYGSAGEAINPLNGISAGWFRETRSQGGFAPGPIAVVDPALSRFYKLQQVSQPGNTDAYQIEAFDLKSFQLLGSILVPGDTGFIQALSRWGQAGLAFLTTSGASGTGGSLYLVDGAFVNPSASPDSTAGMPLAPVPVLTGLSPLSVAAGSGTQVLTITGRDFTGQPTAFWNGTALATTMLSSTELSVQVPAADLATPGQISLTVANNSTGLPVSAILPFAVNDPPPAGIQLSQYLLGGNNLIWDAGRAKLYVSVPGAQGDAGDAIATVDPASGAVSSVSFPGAEPDRLSVADGGQFLYVGLDAQNAINQLTLPDMAVSDAWNLGGQIMFGGPYYALDLRAAPGAPGTTAVSLAQFGLSPSSSGVEVFDGSTPRPELPSVGYNYTGLEWGASSSVLYALDESFPQSFLVLNVSSAGPVRSHVFDGILRSYSSNMHFDSSTGLIYTDQGQVLRPSDGSILGNFNASGIVAVDAALNRVFILGQTAAQANTANYTIESFDKMTLAPVDSLLVENVVGTPTGFVRWGTEGLAFTTRVGRPWEFSGGGPGELYVLQGAFVPSVATPTAQSQLLPVQRTWGTESTRTAAKELSVHAAP